MASRHREPARGSWRRSIARILSPSREPVPGSAFDSPQERSVLTDHDEPMATEESAADLGLSAAVGEISS